MNGRVAGGLTYRVGLGYEQYDQAGLVIPQVATLQPLTATLQYTKSF